MTTSPDDARITEKKNHAANADQSVNPYDGKILKTFEEFTGTHLKKALQTAAACFETWRHTTFAKRAAIARQAATMLISHEQANNPAFREEFFGPVALFFRVTDEDDAVALANDSDYGLGGSVFTPDVARGKHVASRLDTGMVFIDHPTWTSPELPFGGIKNFGCGRELSSLGILEFVNKKTGARPIDRRTGLIGAAGREKTS